MKPPDSRLPVALQSALHHIKSTVSTAAERLALVLATRSDAASRSATEELRRNMSAVLQAFNETLADKVLHDIAPRSEPARKPAAMNWQSLSLVADDEVDERMFADRMGQQISHACEWELRELTAHMAALLGMPSADQDRNPFRPNMIGAAAYSAIKAASSDGSVRNLLVSEFGAGLSRSMKDCYATILRDLQSRGIQPVGMSVKAADGRPSAAPGNASAYAPLARGTSGQAPLGAREGDVTRAGGATPFQGSGQSELGQSRYGPSTDQPRYRSASGALPRSGHGAVQFAPNGSEQTEISEAQLMNLLRRLSAVGGAGGARDARDVRDSGPAGFEASSLGSSSTGQGEPSEQGVARAMGGASIYGDGQTGMMAVNLIRAHRDELAKVSTGTLDHMVIDVVGSLFDQILSDSRVPPQMARQIARLQLPVLRVALGDPTFFSSRKHPVRRFVNRIASLACAFDEFDEGPGKTFLDRVRQLVQEIIDGDFDQLDVYATKLSELEAFIAQPTGGAVQEHGDAVTLLENKESELRVQQRYLLQLQSALAPIPMHAYLRDFVSQVWSQAIALATRRAGPDSELALRMRRAGCAVVMSVQPKGLPVLRQKFLMGLPGLIKDLNEGLKLIGWPEAAQKNFFGQLLPSHAQSLKEPSISELDYNLLAKRLEAIFAVPLPGAEARRHAETGPELADGEIENRFSPEEAKRVGLVEEGSINWAGELDINLSADTDKVNGIDNRSGPDTHSGVGASAIDPVPLDTGVDINLELSPAEPPEPTRGAQLADHINLGFAYQMHLHNQWQKVRLSYVSPGRTFFVFTHGIKHQQTVSLTARMLTRMCESERLRAVENTYLMERATARARQQLAALKASSART